MPASVAIDFEPETIPAPADQLVSGSPPAIDFEPEAPNLDFEHVPHAGLLDLFGYKVAKGGITAVQGLLRGISAIASDDQKRKVTDDAASALETYKRKTLPAYYGVTPDDEESTKGKIVGAAANVFDIAPGPAMMISKMAGQTFSDGYDQSVNQQITAGETNEEQIRSHAQKEAARHLATMAPVLAAYALGGKIAGKVTNWIAPEAGPLARGLIGGTAATGANLLVSGGTRAGEGQPIVGDLEQNLTDSFFGIAGGMHEAFRPSRARGSSKATANSETPINFESESAPAPDTSLARFRKEEPIPVEAETNATAPKLLPGENQGDLIASTQTEPFALAGEQGIDHAAESARAEAEALAREEARLRTDHEQELLRGFEEDQATHGDELLSAIQKGGGLPALSSPRQQFGGELQLIREEYKAPNRKEPIAYATLFRKDAPDIDGLTQHLRTQGFDVETPGDTLNLIRERLRIGKPVYGNEAAGAEFGALSGVSSPATPPTSAPPVRPGVTMTMDGRLPVTLPRTGPGSVSAPEVMDALKRVMVTSGSVGEIRRGRFSQRARGVFKPQSEVVRLDNIDNVPTAVHETGHALMKQVYGTVKASGLKVLPMAVRRELVGLGKALYGKRKPLAGYSGEGFAEFVRHYLTTDDARTVAPNTLKFFEEQVLPKHPEVADQLQASRKLIDVYRTQGAVERANRQIVRDPGWTRRTLGALRDFFTFQKQGESGLPYRELAQEAARKRGAPLPPSEDPYKLFKMKRGAAGAIVERMVDQNMVDLWGNPTGPSLREAFAEIKGDRKPFLLYMFARAAEQRWSEGKNPGITLEDARYIRSTLENQRFDRAATKYQRWQHGLLDYVAQADPTLAPLVARLKQNGFYAPLSRLMDENAVRREITKSQGNPIYRMHGSGLPVKDLFDQTIVNASRLVNRANRALITNAVFKLAEIEGMGRIIEEVPIDQVRKQVSAEQIRRGLEDLGIDTSALPEDHIFDYYTPADQPKGIDPIVAMKQPDRSMRWFHVAPKLYDVLNKLEPFSFRSIPHLGFALDLVIGAPKRLFTLGTTGLRPTFSLITNPLRDWQGWIMQTKAGFNPAKMAAAYFNAVREQIVSAAGGKEGPLSNAAYNLGAHMAQPLGRDISHTRRVSNQLFHGRALRLVLNPLDHARQLLGIPESFPRLAEFNRVAEEIGWKPGTPMTPDQAVQLSLAFKEATVDFSASGDVSRIINEAVPFYNPSIQGARTAVRTFRDHPLRTTLLGLGGFTVPTLLLWWKNKDKDWYRNLPWRERYLYNHVDDGTNVWQIPRAFEWGNAFQVMPEAALDSWYRQDPAALTAAMGHVFETQNPVDYPVALRVAKEQWQNCIDFWERPIVPKSEIDLIPGAQVGPYTTKVAQLLGQAFPNTISPRRLDAAIRGFAGGAVPDILDAVGLGSLKATKQSELADAPIVGRLWRRGGYYNAQSQPIADFWDIKQGVDARVAAYKFALKDPEKAKTAKPPAHDMAMDGVFDGTGKTISLLMHVASQMRESKERQRIYKLAADQARQIVELWKTQEKSLSTQRAR